MNQSEALINKLKQGDQSGFTTFMDIYQDMVYNTAIGIVQNADDADDITQEVFVQVYLSINSFKGESRLSTWLYRITISKALDHEKKKKRKKRFAFIQSLVSSQDNEQFHPVEFNHPGVQLEKKERAAELFNALKQLPEKQRVAFMLHKMEGQSYQEIAEIMSTSLYAVESLMGRAKTNLKKYYPGITRENFRTNKKSCMNNKEHIDKLIEEALNSVDNLVRATPKPFLYTRFNARLNKTKQKFWERAGLVIGRPAIAIPGLLMLIIVNVTVILLNKPDQFSTTAEQGIQAPADEFYYTVATIDDIENNEP